jgi:hypothetical protein
MIGTDKIATTHNEAVKSIACWRVTDETKQLQAMGVGHENEIHERSPALMTTKRVSLGRQLNAYRGRLGLGLVDPSLRSSSA